MPFGGLPLAGNIFPPTLMLGRGKIASINIIEHIGLCPVENSTPVRLYAWIHFLPSQMQAYNLTEFELFNRTKTNGIYDTIFPPPTLILGGYIMFNPCRAGSML